MNSHFCFLLLNEAKLFRYGFPEKLLTDRILSESFQIDKILESHKEFHPIASRNPSTEPYQQDENKRLSKISFF